MPSVVLLIMAFAYATLLSDEIGMSPAASTADAPTSLSSVSDISEPVKYCSAETRGGISYPKTRACTEARVPCPDQKNIVGTIVRYCACETSSWEMPNTNNCTHKWVFELKSAIKKGDSAEQISRKMASNLEYTLPHQLYGGDITESVQLSFHLLGLARSQLDAVEDLYDRQAKAANFTESFGLYGDYLLSSQALPAWKDLTSSLRVDHASMLMLSLKESASLLADYMLDSPKIYYYDNWRMLVDIYRDVEEASQEGSTELAAYTPLDLRTTEALPSSPDDQDLAATMSPTATSSLTSTLSFNESAQSSIITPQSSSVLDSPSNGTSLTPSSVSYGVLEFANLGQLLYNNNYSKVDSNILCLFVDVDPEYINQLDEPINLTFFHLEGNGSNPRCVFWNFSTSEWSTEGCQLISTNEGMTECACTRMASN